MHRALVYSITFHSVVVFIAWIGVPALLSPPQVISNNIPVELISMSDIKPPKTRPKSNPAIKQKRVMPQIKKTASIQSSSSEIKIPSPPPKKPKLKPKLKTEIKRKKFRRAPPQPKRKPKVDSRPSKKVKKREDRLASILKNLALAKKNAQNSRQSKQISKPEISHSNKKNVFSIDRRRQTTELALKVKDQLTPCWNIPAGAKGLQNMKVILRIRLNPDGSLRTAPNVLDRSRMTKDSFFRAVAESAVRSLQHPRCMPLQLPLTQYDLWKDITFNFDPSEALGQ